MTESTGTEPDGAALAAGAAVVDGQLVSELVARASAGGVSLTGEGGLLGLLTKRVLEFSLEGEVDARLGYGRHGLAGRDGGNSRNGKRSETVLTEVGPVQIEVLRDRDASFAARIVRKRQRRLEGVDGIVLSLSGKGLTTGEISAHLAEVCGVSVSKETISAITDRVLDAMAQWQNRPLDPVYPVIFIDAIRVKIRDGNVVNRPIYLAVGVTVDGARDLLGLWAGEHGDGEAAKFWLRVLTEIKNRGVRDVLMLVCDGFKGLPDAVNTCWEKTIVQTLRGPLATQLVPVCQQAGLAAARQGSQADLHRSSEQAALDRFAEFSDKWERRYPAIIQLWTDAWAEFVPFLRFDVEIRKVVCTTNAIESINARLRRAVNARGHFPTEQAALKRLYMALMGLDPPAEAEDAGRYAEKPP